MMAVMNDLIAFLHARIADDEQTARAATEGPWEVDSEQHAESISTPDGTTVVGGGRWGSEASVFESTEDATHIARHDPARVLAEANAKRLIIADYERFLAERRRAMGGWDSYPDVSPTMAALASVYADHPDYRDEWRP